MKIHTIPLFIITFLVPVNDLFSQENPIIFTDTSMSWEYSTYAGEGVFYWTHQYYTHDTIIESREYSVFHLDKYNYETIKPDPLEGGIIFTGEIYIRQNGGDLYVRQKNGYDSLMFSKNWEIGDTIVFSSVYPELTVSVDRIDTIQIGTNSYRQWVYRDYLEHNYIKYIEGIGSTVNDISFPIIAEPPYSGSLECFNISGISEYGTKCLISKYNEVRIRDNSEIKVFPNPTNNGRFKVQIPTDKIGDCRLEVINIDGKVIITHQLDNEIAEITLPEDRNTVFVVSVLLKNQLVKSFLIHNNIK